MRFIIANLPRRRILACEWPYSNVSIGIPANRSERHSPRRTRRYTKGKTPLLAERRREMGHPGFISLSRRFEVEVCEVHVSLGQDVHCQDAFPGWKLQSDHARRDVPVMPLPPGNGIGSIECRRNCE